jgi:hypothetical protein
MPKQKSKLRAATKDDRKPRTAAAAKKMRKKTGGGRSTKKATATSKKVTSAASSRKLARNLPAFLTASTSIDRLLATKEEWSKTLLRPRPPGALRSLSVAASPAPESNVVGVGIGEQVENGRHTGILALKFLVRVKYGADQLTSSDRLPESIDGLPTDVEEVGTFRAFQTQDPQSMLRPSPPGCSVGFDDPGGQLAMAGTFGALVKRGTRRFILSNNHVLANENELAIGAPTFQPGFLDAGNPPSTSPIGTLSAFVELRSTDNLVDCAISEVSDLSLVTNSIIRIGVPQGVTQAQNSMSVHKFGRTTRFRVGFIDSTMMDVSVDYRMGTLTFRDQIIIKGLNGDAFSNDGDSGALVVERNTSRAVGLLFAGSSSHTIANHISDVLQALNVSLS